MDKTERAAILAAAAAYFRKRERETAEALLAAEGLTLHATKSAARAAHERTASAVAEATAVHHAAEHVRQAIPHVVADLTAALSRGAVLARARARVVAGATSTRPLLTETAAAHTFAEVTATSVASQWAGRALAGIRADEPARGLREAREALEGAVERASTTETAIAFNEELEQLYTAAEGSSPYTTDLPSPPRPPELPPGPPGAPPGDEETFVVWSAMLDVRTCPECAALHGTVRRASEGFEGGPPPLHPRCRCVPVYLRLPAGVTPEELEAAFEEQRAA